MTQREITVLTDVALITCIVQKGLAEPMVDAAREAGAQGATVYYARGSGVRERLGILGIVVPGVALLGAAVSGHVAVQFEHGVRHVLHHPLHDAGFHHAHHRQVRRQRGEVELVDAGAGGEQQLQVRKLRPQVGRRHPGGKVPRFVRVADLGPEPEVDLRRVAAEDVGPLLAALAVGLVDEDRPHQRFNPGPG